MLQESMLRFEIAAHRVQRSLIAIEIKQAYRQIVTKSQFYILEVSMLDQCRQT